MISWDKETEEIIEKYSKINQEPSQFKELEMEKLKIKLIFDTIGNSNTLIEAEERGNEAKKKVREICYSFSFVSLKERKRQMKEKQEKLKQFMRTLNTNVTQKGEFYSDLLNKAKERINYYELLTSIPIVTRHTIEKVLLIEIDKEISKTKKNIIKKAIVSSLKPKKEIRILLDKKQLTIITDKAKIQYETSKAETEIEDLFRIKEVFNINLNTIESPLIIDAKTTKKGVLLDITEKIFEHNCIKTKNHSILLNT